MQYAREVEPGEDGRSYRDNLARYLVDILFIARANGDLNQLYNTIINSFGGRLTEIMNFAVSLRRAIKEDTLSAEFQLVIPRDGDTFQPETMADLDARPAKRAKQREIGDRIVLCTTDIGLIRDERRSCSSGNVPESTSVVMLKAKVALEPRAQDA